MVRRGDLFVAVALASAFAFAGCSSSDDGGDEHARSGDIRTNDVWTDGIELTGTVRIIAPAVVDIAPGAKIKCAPGVSIFVGGTLRKAAGATSRIACDEWLGITVAQGGTVALEGVALVNAAVGITTTEGAGEVSLRDSSIENSVRPFFVGKDSKLALERVQISTPAEVPDNVVAMSEVHGTLTATHLSYDAGPSEGISLREGGSAVITDSSFKATHGLDMVSAYDAKTLELSYSTMNGAHCGVHVQGLDSFTIDHITSDENSFGITIYKAGAGPNVIKDSNLHGNVAWLDLQGDHGPILFQNVYTSGGKPIIQNTDPPDLGSAAPAPIADAKPR